MKHRYFAVVAAALSLAACATLPEAPPMKAAPAYYDALGTEPFWSLEAYDNIMSFNDGDEQITRVMEYRATSTLNGWRYVSKNVTADVTFTQCSDGMSDRTYKDTVTVTRGKETFKGCGGGILPPTSLEHTVWRVASINGAETPPSQGAPLSFDDGRMSGTVGCNRLSADYIYAGGKLSFGPVMSTRMACQDPLASLEYAFVTLLGASPETRFTNNGSIILAGKDGVVIKLEQSI
jgi:heat shock protein HslJ